MVDGGELASTHCTLHTAHCKYLPEHDGDYRVELAEAKGCVCVYKLAMREGEIATCSFFFLFNFKIRLQPIRLLVFDWVNLTHSTGARFAFSGERNNKNKTKICKQFKSICTVLCASPKSFERARERESQTAASAITRDRLLMLSERENSANCLPGCLMRSVCVARASQCISRSAVCVTHTVWVLVQRDGVCVCVV